MNACQSVDPEVSLVQLKTRNFAFCALLECTQEITSINKIIDGKFPLIKFSHKSIILRG